MATPRKRRVCSVPYCTSIILQHEKRSFFRFPKDETLCRKWVTACKRKDFLCKSPQDLYNNFRVCSDHFEQRMFVNNVKNRRLTDAVPTIFNFQNTPRSTNSARKYIKRRAEFHESQPAPKKLKINPNNSKNFGSFDVANGSADSESTNSLPPLLKTPSAHQGTPAGHKKAHWGGSRCAVVTCVNKSLITKINPATSHIVYHMVPKTPEVRKCWLDSCGRGSDWTVAKACICSEHFAPDDYEFVVNSGPDNSTKKKRLKKTAVPSQKLGKDAPSEKRCKEAASKKLGKDAPSKKLGRGAPSDKLFKDALSEKLGSDATSQEPVSVITNDNTETYRWPVIDKVYAQWKDHSSPAPSEIMSPHNQIATKAWVYYLKRDELVAKMRAAGIEVFEKNNMESLRKKFLTFLKIGSRKVDMFQENNLPGQETEVVEQIKIKQEFDDPSVAAILTGTKPCVVNLSLNNILAKRDCKDHLKMIRSEMEAVFEKSSAEVFKPQLSPAGRKRSPAGRKRSPSVRKESPSVRKRSPSVRKGSPAVQKESPAVRKGSPAVRKGSPATRKEGPAVKKKSLAVQMESPALRKGSSSIKSRNKSFEEKPETVVAIGKRWQRPFVKLDKDIPEKSFGARQPKTCDKNMLQTVHSEEKVDKLVSGIKFGGPVLCVNLGKPVTQEMVHGQSLRVRSAKSNYRRKFGYRNRRGFSGRRGRISHTGGKSRISTIGVKSQLSENRILLSGGSSSVSPLISPTKISPQWPHDSQMQRYRYSSGIIPENVTIPVTNSEINSNEWISDVFIPTTDDSTETSSEMIPENMTSPNADEFERNVTNKKKFLNQGKNLKTEPELKKLLVEEIHSKLVMKEKKKRKRVESQAGFVAPVRRTERVPVKKKFLGEFEGPAKRNRRSLLLKTPSAAQVESLSSPPPLPPPPPPPPSPPPVETPSPLPIMSSVSPVETSFSVSMKSSSSVKTPSVPVKAAITLKTPSSVPARSTPPVKVVSTPLRSSAASAKSLTPEMVGATAEERCFVCDKPARGGVSVHRLTGSSKIHIHEKLDKILGVDRLTLKLEEDGLLCSRCALLLNYVDRIEVELNMLNQAILNCMRPKCTTKSKGKATKPDVVEPTVRTEEPANDVASLEKPALPTKHVCRICRFKTPYQSLMIFHLRQHLKVNSYRCDFCNGQLQASEAAKCLKPKLRKKLIE